MKEFLKKIEPFLPIPLIAVFLWIYYLCNVKLGVYANDDILYATNLVTGEPLHNLSDIYESQIWHYFNWGGRSVAHTILQILFLMGDTFINIFNPFACLAFAAVGNLFFKKKNLWTLLAVLAGIFALNPIWYETQLWQTGIANYLYLAILYLAFIYFYVRKAEGDAEVKEPVKFVSNDVELGQTGEKDAEPVNGETKSVVTETAETGQVSEKPEESTPRKKIGTEIAACLGMAVLGLLTGWSNENIGPAIFIGMLYIIIRQKRKVSFWMVAGEVAALVGCVLMILAPGNYGRAGEALEQTDLKGMTALLVRLYAELLAIYVYLSHMLPVFLASVVFYKGYLKAKFKRGDMVLLTIAILSVGAMILTPHYPNRAIFGTCAFLLILAIRLINREREAIPFLMRRIAVLLLWAAGIYRMLIYYFE